MTNKVISIKNLNKKYFQENSEILVLDEINFNLHEGEIISIMGPSGSGKSTFLNIIGMLDSEYDGQYIFFNDNVEYLTNHEKNFLRNSSIGFIHQFFHLIPELSVRENVALPRMIKTNDKKKSLEVAENLINQFGLLNRIDYKPVNLSGGEQQRIAIARALVNEPKIIISDEMTGNLDEDTSDSVFDFFLKQVRKSNQTVIFVTHNEKYAQKADLVYKIQKKKMLKI